jgi:hypothetical protein
MTQGYRILDEPRPGPHAHLAVNPFWILLASMLGGAWLAWPWFIFNALAIGSATRVKEIALVAVGVVGSVVLYFAIAALVSSSVLDQRYAAYALLGLVAYKLGISYALHVLQSRSFQLHEYFGGAVRNGMLLVILGLVARGPVLERLGGSMWSIVFA